MVSKKTSYSRQQLIFSGGSARLQRVKKNPPPVMAAVDPMQEVEEGYVPFEDDMTEDQYTDA